MFWHESVYLSTLAGGTPSQVWMGGYPWPGLDGVSSQTWDRVPPDLGWGTLPDLGQGTPWPGMGHPPRPGMGHPPDLGWGTPLRPGTGYPPPDLGWGTPLQTWHWVTPPGPGTRYPPRPGTGYPPQHSEHLQRGGQCASCVHAGGLSCCSYF